MILYLLISTPSLSAISCASFVGFVLKPMIIDLEVIARLTSDSVIAPTDECITVTFI